MLNLTREERFDRFTRIAQYIFNTPIAVITRTLRVPPNGC